MINLFLSQALAQLKHFLVLSKGAEQTHLHSTGAGVC